MPPGSRTPSHKLGPVSRPVYPRRRVRHSSSTCVLCMCRTEHSFAPRLQVVPCLPVLGAHKIRHEWRLKYSIGCVPRRKHMKQNASPRALPKRTHTHPHYPRQDGPLQSTKRPVSHIFFSSLCS